MTLMSVQEPLDDYKINSRVVRFWVGHWYKTVTRLVNGSIEAKFPATREEIMTVLADMDLLLIR